MKPESPSTTMRSKNIVVFAFSALCLLAGLHASALPVEKSPYIFFDEEQLAQAKADIFSNKPNPKRLEAFHSLIAAGDISLKQVNESVTEKNFTPPSKTKHDYLSYSRYWWPDPTKESGIPWIRKDGITNPDTQSDNLDRFRLERFTQAVYTLGLAYYFTGEEKYAKKASSMLRAWFLDEKTHMRPNLNYSQMVPGFKPRRSGVLDGRVLPQKVLDSVTMIQGSQHWNTQQNQALNAWLSEYLTWLTESKLGKQAKKFKNNHGAWYHFHVAAVAYHIGEYNKAKSYIKSAKKLIAIQIDPSGKFTHELTRTRSFFYSAFNLDALTRLAIIADKLGEEFWRYETAKGAGILPALDHLALFADGTKEWPYPHKAQQLLLLPQLFIRAQNTLQNNRYQEVLSINYSQPSPYGQTTENRGDYLMERYLFNSLYD